ncbi:MAG: lipase family protein, partial [Mycobacterium sp.]
PFIAEGFTVIVPDTEGQRADFATGPEYGMKTLDSIRAAFNSSTVPSDAKIAMIGYSGGGLATEWAAELGPTYAPDINERMIGAAMGGLLVDPAHNLHYIEGTGFWAGVMPMALIGIARAFEIDLTPYLNPYGIRVFHELQAASIINVLGQYPGLKWTDLVSPEYPTPESLPVYVRCANQLIMGTGGTPAIPLFIGQGANGDLELTPGDKKGIGPGDGVMIAGDVRTLARGYCANGTKVHYEQYDALSHIWSIPIWLPNSIAWINRRFAGLPASENCSSIAPGNALEPIPEP